MKKIFLLAFLSVFLLTGCTFTNAVWSSLTRLFTGKLPTQQMVLETKKGSVELKVEVADREGERERGLMEREEVKTGEGMWFVFEDEAPRSFWMKNTLVPLDIIFFDSQKKVVSIVDNMEPCKAAECPGYDSATPAMFALEVPAGFAAENGLNLGDTVAEDQ